MYDNNLHSIHKFGIAFAKELLPDVLPVSESE
jgi:hypothetical protein